MGKISFRSVCISVLTLIITAGFAGLLASLVFLVPLRTFVRLTSKFLRRDLVAMVSGADSLMILRDQGTNPVNIVVAPILDGQLTPKRLRELFQSQIFTSKDPKAVLIAEKLQNFYQHFLGYPFWVKEKPFNLDFHIRKFDYLDKDIRLPEICTEKDVSRILGNVSRLPWRSTSSPWEILLHQKYQRVEDTPGEFKTLCLLRISHVLGDGYSIAELLRTFSGSSVTFPNVKINAGKAGSGFWAKIWAARRIPGDIATDVYECLVCRNIRFFPPIKDEARRFNYSVSSPISVDVIKEIKNRHGVNFNSVLVSLMMAATQKTMKAKAKRPPTHLGACFVLPAPNRPSGMTNHAIFAPVKFPFRDESARERLKGISEKISSVQDRTTAAVFFSLRNIIQFIPTFLKSPSDWLASTFFSFALTSFPATTSADFIDDMEMLDGFQVASAFAGLDFVILIGGYNNRLRFNFVVERTYFDSENTIHSFQKYLEQEILELTVGKLPI